MIFRQFHLYFLIIISLGITTPALALTQNEIDFSKSMLALKENNPTESLTLFKRVTLNQLNLGRYEIPIKLQFLLLDPLATSADYTTTLASVKATLSDHPIYTQLTLKIANRFKENNDLNTAKKFYQELMSTPCAESQEATEQLLPLAIDSQDKALSLSLLKKWTQTYYNVFKADIFYSKFNQQFATSIGVRHLLDTPDLLLQFLRQRYDKLDYGPTQKFGTLFVTQYPSHNSVLEIKTNMAMCHYLQGNYTSAIASFNALVTSPSITYWQQKATFYKGRTLQKLKKWEEAKPLFTHIIDQCPPSEFTTDSYYYLYWCYSETGSANLFMRDYFPFKRYPLANSKLEMLIWKAAWECYTSGNETQALELLQKAPMPSDSDENKAKITFWLGKMTAKTQPEKSEFYLQKCSNKFPLSYYAFRLHQNDLETFKSKVKQKISPTGLIANPYYLYLSQLGLSEWVQLDLTSQLKQKPNKTTAYTLALLQNQDNRHYQAIQTLSRAGLQIKNNDGTYSQEFLQLLYPLANWETVKQYSAENKIDPYFALALMREESLFNPKATSKSGALGLMQLMPFTASGLAKELRVSVNIPEDLYIPSQNIQFGTRYLGILKNRFSNNFAHMASSYNAGPNATLRWLKKNQPLDEFVASIPYAETNGYVTRVLKSYWIYRVLYQ